MPADDTCCFQRAALATATRMAICGALSAAFLALPTEVPHIFSPDHVSWIFITALVVASAAGDCLGQAIVKSLDRALGTALGAFLGAVMAMVTYAISLATSGWFARCFVMVGLSLLTGLLFYFPAASTSQWVKNHQYAFMLAPITLGMVWLVPVAPDRYELSLYRFFEIVLGIIVGMVSLAMSHPGFTIYVVHQGIGTTASKAADLIDMVCSAHINRQSLNSLTHYYKAGFEDDDDVRKAYRGIGESVAKMRSLLPFADWELRCLHPASLSWLPCRAPLRYRLLIGRLTRLNATAMALDSQLRAFSSLPALDGSISSAARTLTDRVVDLLRESAMRLDARLSGQDSDFGEWGQDDLLRGVRAGMEGLSRAANGGGTSNAPSEGKLEPSITDILGPEIEMSYNAWTGPTFVLLNLQLAIQATLFFADAMKLLEGDDGAEDEDDDLEEEDEEDEEELQENGDIGGVV